MLSLVLKDNNRCPCLVGGLKQFEMNRNGDGESEEQVVQQRRPGQRPASPRRTGQRRRRPMQPLFKLRDTEQGPAAVVKKALVPNPRHFYKYFRMEKFVYKLILGRVGPYIRKKTTAFKKPITPHQRLMATLRFLITGVPLEQLQFSQMISPSSLHTIIPEVCAAIIDAFGSDYMKVS